MLQSLLSRDDLSAAITRSFVRPILIFKHSSRCGTSAMAHEELQELLAGTPIDADVYLLHIQASRDVSNAVAEQLRVRHESPQALLIHQGALVWQASHFRVTEAAMRQAIHTLRPIAG